MHETQNRQHDGNNVGSVLILAKIGRVFKQVPARKCIGWNSKVSQKDEKESLADEDYPCCSFKLSMGENSASSYCDIGNAVQQAYYRSWSHGIHRDHSSEEANSY